MAFRHVKKAQQLIQVGFDAGYGVGAMWFPEEFPLAEGAECLVFVVGAVDGGGLGDAGPMLAGDFAGDIAHFVGPAELQGCLGED